MSTTPRTLTDTESFLLLGELLKCRGTAKKKEATVRNYLMGLLMLDAGLRVGELVQLRISDLWFNSVPVKSIILSAEITKTKESRTVPLSQRLSAALKEYYWYFITPGAETSNGFVFRSKNSSKHITTRQVERIINGAAIRSIGRPIHPHVLRHTFADRLRSLTDLKTLQELLGHKRLSSTQVYMHPSENDKRLAIEKMASNSASKQSGPTDSTPGAAVPNNPDTMHAYRDVR